MNKECVQSKEMTLLLFIPAKEYLRKKIEKQEEDRTGMNDHHSKKNMKRRQDGYTTLET